MSNFSSSSSESLHAGNGTDPYFISPFSLDPLALSVNAIPPSNAFSLSAELEGSAQRTESLAPPLEAPSNNPSNKDINENSDDEDREIKLDIQSKQWACPSCKVSYSQKGKLKAHVEKHHSKTYDKEFMARNFPPKMTRQGKIYPCMMKDCGSGFNQACSRNRHLKKKHPALWESLKDTLRRGGDQ